jgi:hypothetical protein
VKRPRRGSAGAATRALSWIGLLTLTTLGGDFVWLNL